MKQLYERFRQHAEDYFARLRALPDLRVPESFLAVTILFLLVQLVSILLTGPAEYLLESVSGLVTGKPVADGSAQQMVMQLLTTGICIVLSVGYCRLLENRPFAAIGFRRKHALRQFLGGALLGIGMFGAAVLLAWAGGALRFEGGAHAPQTGTLLAFLFAWTVQGFSEEIAFRSWLTVSIGVRRSPAFACIWSAFLFALMHTENDGFSLLPFCNLMLFGIFAALCYLRTEAVWMPGAMHALWNCVQGNLFGLQVSGIPVPASLLHFSQNDSGRWLNGGVFGLEGGFAVTAVIAAGILTELLLLRQKQRADHPKRA